MTTPEQAARAALDCEVAAMAHLVERADLDAIAEAARLIDEAGFTVTCGSGSSGFAAAKFAHSLCCVNKPAKFMSPAEAVHGGLGAIRPGDAVIIVSRGGKTAELLPCIDGALAKGGRIIGITEKLDSELARASACILPMVITRESDPLNVMATTSNMVVGALLDAVLAAVMVRTQYKIEDFAVIHPGGAVGARLNQKG